MASNINNKSKISILLTGALAILIIILSVYFLSSRSETEKTLLQKASEINNGFPLMIDDETRADSVTILGKDTLLYHYTLIKVQKETLDVATLQSQFSPILIYNVKQSKELETLKEKNIVFGYTYNDYNQKEIFTFFITPEMYKGHKSI